MAAGARSCIPRIGSAGNSPGPSISLDPTFGVWSGPLGRPARGLASPDGPDSLRGLQCLDAHECRRVVSAANQSRVEL